MQYATASKAPAPVLILGALLFSLMAPAPVRADEPMPRKAGLWEMSMMGRKMLVCVDAESEAAAFAKGKAMMTGMCSKLEIHRTATGYVQDTVCKMMNSTQTSHHVTEFKGDGEFSVEITMHYEPPFMGKSDDTVKQAGKWLGPCGPDLKPGEMSINGRKMQMPGM
jgi:hypothetical protein